MPGLSKSYGPKLASKKLPAPKSKKVIDRDHKVMSPSNAHSTPFAMKKGKGCLVWDEDGNRYLDLTSGIAVSSTGYGHPKITKAIKKQVDEYLHICSPVFYSKIQCDYAERLVKHVPIKGNGKNKVFFGNSGTEVWEGAIKLARYHTKRRGVIAFYGSFHGRTYGGISANASKIYQRKGFGPMLPDFYHAFYPRPYPCPSDVEYPTSVEGCLSYIKDVLFEKIIDPQEVACIALEPIQGEGGYIVPPKAFFKGLRKICDAHGILLIVDEVQSGMGRTGKMFALEHFGVKADIICAAKGIASGMPLGAFIANEKTMSWQNGAHGSTFGGNPVALAAASATLDLLEGGLVKNAQEVGQVFIERLSIWPDKFPCVGDVRGMGLMIGIEIVKHIKGITHPDPVLRDKIIAKCFEHGLLMLPCGSNSVRIAPPLVINKKQASLACDIMETVLVNL